MPRPRPATAADADEKSVAARRPAMPADDACQLCSRPLPLTFHHLSPRRVHGRSWFRARHSIEDMRLRGVWLCRECHRFIHDHFDEGTLGRRLNTLALLAAEPIIARHVEWAARQRVAAR